MLTSSLNHDNYLLHDSLQYDDIPERITVIFKEIHLVQYGVGIQDKELALKRRRGQQRNVLTGSCHRGMRAQLTRHRATTDVIPKIVLPDNLQQNQNQPFADKLTVSLSVLTSMQAPVTVTVSVSV